MGISEKFRAVFPTPKPVLAMLHLKGDTPEEILKRAELETAIYRSEGVSGVIVENYFGDEAAVEMVLEHMRLNHRDVVYGVNMLDDDKRGFAAAAKYDAKFIQLDSVAGHLTPEDDAAFARDLREWRAATSAIVLGGVRFKYQPYKSGRSLEEDLRLGMERCDAVVVTGEGTGMTTAMEKIREFRAVIGDFPLLVGAGVTPENCAERFAVADGAIVGSYFKDNHADNGEVDRKHVNALMRAIKAAGF